MCIDDGICIGISAFVFFDQAWRHDPFSGRKGKLIGLLGDSCFLFLAGARLSSMPLHEVSIVSTPFLCFGVAACHPIPAGSKLITAGREERWPFVPVSPFIDPPSYVLIPPQEFPLPPIALKAESTVGYFLLTLQPRIEVMDRSFHRRWKPHVLLLRGIIISTR